MILFFFCKLAYHLLCFVFFFCNWSPYWCEQMKMQVIKTHLL